MSIVNQEIFEWLLLLGRWLHITVGITWIGSSIFFMWLDRTLEVNEVAKGKNPQGHVGDLWMVHGGGFYHVEKLLMGPTRVPENLHWFKWESYWTWTSGIFLLAMIFYAGSGTFLLDSSVSTITYWQAVTLSLGSLIGSWVFYDQLWETKFTKTTPVIGHIITLIWFAGVAYLLCNTLSGRAAYIHIGGMLGTWMTANVFLRIIPRQVLMVEASKNGQPVNQEWGKNAKNRSTHNTYFTLPVIFIMLSNHFPSTYGNKHNWLILLAMSAAGAAIREFFVVRIKNPSRSKTFGVIGALLILAVMFFTQENHQSQTASPSATPAVVAKATLAPPLPNTTHLVGTVQYTGTRLQGEKLLLPLTCATQGDVYSNDILVKNGRLKNVLVRVIKGLDGKQFNDIPAETVVLDQKNCQYEPRVIAVRVGQKVDITNSDATFHNVRSVTKNNEDFNVAMPSQNDKVTKVFSKPEIVLQTKCSVHPWMSASIAVIEHPYYALTNTDGEFTIQNLPDGTYTIEAWHEIFGKQSQELTISKGQPATLNFTFK